MKERLPVHVFFGERWTRHSRPSTMRHQSTRP
jgi:hypothetical protein